MGDEDPGHRAFNGGFEVLGQSAAASEPTECSLNGLITNDKFCLTRAGKLQLSWPRARHRLRRAVAPNTPVRSLTGEESMQGQRRRAWHVRRTSVPTPRGARKVSAINRAKQDKLRTMRLRCPRFLLTTRHGKN
jgi:hypothetical protein